MILQHFPVDFVLLSALQSLIYFEGRVNADKSVTVMSCVLQVLFLFSKGFYLNQFLISAVLFEVIHTTLASKIV